MIPTMQLPQNTWNPNVPHPGVNGHNRVADIHGGFPNPAVGYLNQPTYGAPIHGFAPNFVTNPYINNSLNWQSPMGFCGPVPTPFGVLNPYQAQFYGQTFQPPFNPYAFNPAFNPLATNPYAAFAAWNTPFGTINPYVNSPYINAFGGMPIQTPAFIPTPIGHIPFNTGLGIQQPINAWQPTIQSPIHACAGIPTNFSPGIWNNINPTINPYVGQTLPGVTPFGIKTIAGQTGCVIDPITGTVTSTFPVNSPFCHTGGIPGTLNPFATINPFGITNPLLAALGQAPSIGGFPGITNPLLANSLINSTCTPWGSLTNPFLNQGYCNTPSFQSTLNPWALNAGICC